MKRVFVTGGSGFVGKQLIKELLKKNVTVVALARSVKSEQILNRLGAISLLGDICTSDKLAEKLAGCDVLFHLAAVTLQAGGTESEYYQTNVVGTEKLLEAAKKARVKRFIFVSTDAVLIDGHPIINADEKWSIPDTPFGSYAKTKALAERKVIAANSAQLTTIILRPRFIWGKESKGINTIIRRAKQGKLVFIGGGKQMTSTCHINNICEALLLAMEKGKGGSVYFVSDGQHIELRTFINSILKERNISPIKYSIPFWLAFGIACILEVLWKLFQVKGIPPFTRVLVYTFGLDFTFTDNKARKELGYRGKFSMQEGFEEFKG